MIIVRKSPITGKMNTRKVDVTEQQYISWENGELIQNAMAHLSPEDREFIVSGCTPEDFDFLFPAEEV